MKHYFANVLGLGNVALSRHAQEQAAVHHVSEMEIEEVLAITTLTPRPKRFVP